MDLRSSGTGTVIATETSSPGPLSGLDGATSAALGACCYVVLFGVRLAYDLPLLALAAGAALAAVRGTRGRDARAPLPLAIPLLAFLLSTGLSLATSVDPRRSLALSEPLVPGALLFLTIAGHFRGHADIRRLYVAFSLVTLGLGAAILVESGLHPGVDPSGLVTRLRTPALLVPNDVALLAVTAPLSWALLASAPGGATALVAGCSLLVGAGAIAVLQSRVAALAMVAGIGCVAATRSRRAALTAACGIAAAVLTVDLLRGLPLLHKFTSMLDPRLALWCTALAMFRDAPWLGHGPHTFGVLQEPYVAALALPSWIPVDQRSVPWTHNLYLETLAEQGVVGLAALVVLLAAALRRARYAAAHAPGAEARTLAAGALGGLVAIAVAGLVELSFVREWVVVATFALLGVTSHHSALRAHDQEEPS